MLKLIGKLALFNLTLILTVWLGSQIGGDEIEVFGYEFGLEWVALIGLVIAPLLAVFVLVLFGKFVKRMRHNSTWDKRLPQLWVEEVGDSPGASESLRVWTVVVIAAVFVLPLAFNIHAWGKFHTLQAWECFQPACFHGEKPSVENDYGLYSFPDWKMVGEKDLFNAYHFGLLSEYSDGEENHGKKYYRGSGYLPFWEPLIFGAISLVLLVVTIIRLDWIFNMSSRIRR